MHAALTHPDSYVVRAKCAKRTKSEEEPRAKLRAREQKPRIALRAKSHERKEHRKRYECKERRAQSVKIAKSPVELESEPSLYLLCVVCGACRSLKSSAEL